ncbi:hypothetical protein SPOG_03581 [Schizosaccharomyces cryophilus OY26]|uniref:Uncharacterized protein n=1 Tax=Schizosaccharomyces cryophilus (strain OY26 / ATCC MYA-4695 / CBS 11777 / NBRC 106824 / NRRL Y48691) TaxID=653667 RepID=S9VQ73_SCHCR|nr:uncharacterized protein SPOG_03581 [Schizosaccharomyces cryophilus OY26]EPY50113.1 hypothetical protein SPOG_03581 [Schizosaccharomyces cryophilus OY26]
MKVTPPGQTRTQQANGSGLVARYHNRRYGCHGILPSKRSHPLQVSLPLWHCAQDQKKFHKLPEYGQYRLIMYSQTNR